MDLCPFDIVLAPVKVGYSLDPRWCIILDICDELVRIVPCSAQLDLYRENTDLLFDDTAVMKTAGFRKPTYAIALNQVLVVHIAEIKKKYGHLPGNEIKRFKKWFGW